MSLAFVDLETSGLYVNRHDVWEVGLIVDDVEYGWFVTIDETKADLIALNIGGYHDRHPNGRAFSDASDFPATVTRRSDVAEAVARLTHGRHLVGACPWFDAAFLTDLLNAAGYQPSWHYHLVDVEALMVGYLRGRMAGRELPIEFVQDDGSVRIPLPWRSKDLSRAVGVDPSQFGEHTAVGDARWAKAVYEAITGTS